MHNRRVQTLKNCVQKLSRKFPENIQKTASRKDPRTQKTLIPHCSEMIKSGKNTERPSAPSSRLACMSCA